MTLAPGTRLGSYEILSLLGAGGMGEVWRAKDVRLGRDVAIKVLPEDFLEGEERRQRFEREAKLLASINHPGIATLYSFEEIESRHLLVMELLEGETLRRRLHDGPLPARKALEVAEQIARGLAAAHDKCVVHRDLKPENVFLTRDGQVKILDFGLAKATRPEKPADESTHVETETSLSQEGAVLGTVGYMSPEQVRSEPADHRSDVFALGVILYEMLTGTRPFRRKSPVETFMAILRDEPPEMSVSGQPVAPEIAEIVSHCLEKSPEERFQSARDLAHSLRIAERDGLPTSGRRGFRAPVEGGGSEASQVSIAVLPFRNLSADRDAEYFSDGMTEEIINALSKVGALRVASRTSAFSFKGKDEDVRRIGAALGVRSVLEGSVRQAGRRIRVTAQLTNVADGYNLWSERYDRELEDVFEVQDGIARAIAETLKVRLLPAEEAHLVRRTTQDVDAFNDYLKGRYFFNRREPRAAIAEFERALDKDPGYAAAWTGLADSICVHGFYGGLDTREAFARARSASSKAHELDPDSPQAHVSIALVEHYFGWDFGVEERELRRAIELAPRDATAYTWLGLVLGLLFHSDEALALSRHAAELEPHSANVQTNVGWNLHAARRFDEAIQEFQVALHIDPGAPYPLWSLGMTQFVSGHLAEAVANLEKGAEVTQRRQSMYLALLGAAYARAGRRAEAEAMLDELRGLSGREYVPPLHFGFLQAALGDEDAALDSLEGACRDRNGLAWYWIRDGAVFDGLRAHPRFPALVAKIVPA